MAVMRVAIVTPQERLYDGEANEVYARSVEGEIGILPGHQPALLQLADAPVRVKGAVGEHGELVVAELQEAAVNLEGVLTGGALDAHRRVGELQQRRLVAGQDADLTFDAAGVDLVGLAVVQPLLRRHDRHAHDRHQDSRRRLAFAMTSSTPPTM